MRLRALVVLVSLAAAMWMGSALASAQTAQTAQAQPGGVRFSNSFIEIEEGAESLRVSVERTGALPVSRLFVDYASESGSARGGADYADTAGTLTFEVGESFKTFAIRVRNDTEAEGREQFTVRLSNARGDSATLGGPATVAIWDDDTPPFDPEAEEADADAPTGAAGTGRRTSTPRPTIAAAPIAPARPSVAAPSATAATAAPSASAVRSAPRAVTRTRRTSATPARRQVSFRQNPVTPFELRPAATGAAAAPALPGRVDPLLALLAGLLLARVTAEVWFRSRVEAT